MSVSGLDRGWWRPSGSPGTTVRGAVSTPHGDSDAPFWALMGFTVVLLLGPQQFFPWLGTIRIALLTAAVAAGTHFYQRLVQKQPLLSLSPEMGIAACLAGWAILSVPLSYWPGGSLNLLLELYFKTLAIFWLLGNIVNSSRKLRLLSWGLALMSIPLAVTALDNYRSGAFIGAATHPQAKRILGYEAPLTENPNDLALVLNLILPLCVTLFLIVRRPLARMTLLIVITLNATAVILTFSRAGFLTLAVIICLYLWKLRGRPEQGWAWAAVVVGLLCLPLLPSGYTDRLSTITDIDSDVTGSAQERWNDTLYAARFVLAHPIVGAGIGMDILALNEQRGPTWRAVHNVYLEYAVDLGVPGLALYLLLLARCLNNTRVVQQRCRDASALRGAGHLAEAIEVSLLAFAFSGLFYPAGYNFPFYYMAGLAVAVKAAYEAESWQTPTDLRRVPTQ